MRIALCTAKQWPVYLRNTGVFNYFALFIIYAGLKLGGAMLRMTRHQVSQCTNSLSLTSTVCTAARSPEKTSN